MMKKTLAAAAAFLFLFCFAAGCMHDNTQATQTDVQTITALLTQTEAETSVTTTVPATTSTTAKPTTDAASTTRPTTSATTVSASAEATTVSTTALTTALTTVATTAATTAAETVKPSTTKEQTTRQSLLERWRERREQFTAPKPDPAFFDDAVFVGDSVTQGLRNYTTGQRNKGNDCLGAAQFLCYGSMSYTNALEPVNSSSMHPVYKGKKVSIEDGVQLCGAKKVFIMLGMNDFSAYSEKAWKQNVLTLIDRIEKKNPGVRIYLESVTPILSGMEHGRFNNSNIQKFNEYLRQVCDERDYTYVDIYSVMADESGHLKKSYCGDPGAMGIHMSASGCAAWSKYLQETFCGA